MDSSEEGKRDGWSSIGLRDDQFYGLQERRPTNQHTNTHSRTIKHKEIDARTHTGTPTERGFKTYVLEVCLLHQTLDHAGVLLVKGVGEGAVDDGCGDGLGPVDDLLNAGHTCV